MDANRDTLARIAALPPADRRAALRALGRAEFERCAADPLYWLFHPSIPYVYTIDYHPVYRCVLCSTEGHRHHKLRTHLQLAHNLDVDALAARSHFVELPPIRPFPHKPYFEPIVRTWQTEQLILVEKSRDMMATWLFVALYAWDTLFHPGRQNFIQSETAKKTRELIRRAHFIWRNQPNFLRPHPVVYTVGTDGSGELHCEALNSSIIGLPQGSDKIRQYHPTGVFTDETAFHPQAAETFAAIKPAIQSGGRYTGVSSAAPSWFMHAALDTLDTP